MREAWDQRLTESDSEFRAFRRWLETIPRSLPPEPALAQREEWQRRAQAWDELHELPQDPGRLVQIQYLALQRAGAVQARRYLRDVVASEDYVPPPRAVELCLAVAAKFQELYQAGQTVTIDTSTLTDEELYALDEAARLLAQKGN